MPSEHVVSTLEHKKEVGKYLNQVSSELFSRAVTHDNSKFSDEESILFEEITPLLKNLTYGSDEYKSNLFRIKPAINHHYQVNSHHPEHYPNGINGMDLMDLVEMICDWLAAVKRHPDGDIYRSLEINKERFNIDDQLYGILLNTVKNLEKGE